MKTIKITIMMAASFFMMTGLWANNYNFNIERETYISDIPFSTHEVSANCMYEMAITKEFSLEEESYIDDIPFSTEKLASEGIYKSAINETFALPEEDSVDDIPFDTEKIAGNMLCKR